MTHDMPLVTELVQTCDSCPSQWEGRIEDGRHVYIRYRWGRLQVGIADTLDEAIRNKVHVSRLGGPFDGILSDDEMKREVSSVLRFG